MTDQAYKPAGYCPHCGYAIAPGVCSECGQNVAASELVSGPYWMKRRRIIKRTVFALVILSLAVGGWYVYARCNWITWVPARILLMAHDGRDGKAARELWRRYHAQATPIGLGRSLIGNGNCSSRGLLVRSPHPRMWRSVLDWTLSFVCLRLAGCGSSISRLQSTVGR